MICKNCNFAYYNTYSYCPNCGQKHDAHRLSVSELFITFIESITNLDGRFYKSLQYIWAPWKSTQFYVEGKRNSFITPVRIFLVTLLIHFGFLVSLFNYETSLGERFTNNSLSNQRFVMSKKLDSFLDIKKQYNNPEVLIFADTIQHKVFNGIKPTSKDTLKELSLLGNKTNYGILNIDAIELPKDSLFQKYKINNTLHKIMISQYIKIKTSPEDGIRYIIKNMAWALFATMFLLATLFKLLYIRQRKFYTEHLVLWMNIHSFSFIFVSILMFLNHDIVKNDDIFLLLFFLPIFVFISMKKYYGQGLLKTFTKFLITVFAYLSFVSFAIIISVIISALLF